MNHTDLCKLTAEKFVQTIALYEVKGHWENPDVIKIQRFTVVKIREILVTNKEEK